MAMQEFDLDEILLGCERLENGDYRTSYGVVIPDPENYRECEVCEFKTYRRVITQNKWGMLVEVRVLCRRCHMEEEKRLRPLG